RTEASAIQAASLKPPPDQYSDVMRTLLYAGTLIPARRYVQAALAREAIIEDQRRALEQSQVLALPTVVTAAPRLGQASVKVGGRTVNVEAALPRLTLPFNLSGFPAVSVPCGFTEQGLPVALQIVGRPFDEGTVLN